MKKTVFDEVEESSSESLQLVPNKLSFTKDDISSQAMIYVSSVRDNGEKSIIEEYSKCLALTEYLDNVKTMMKPDIQEEVEKFGSEGASSNGIKYNLTSSPTTYSFEHYDEWIKQKAICDKQNSRLKELEDKMKKAYGTAGFVDAETGELIPAAVIKKHGDSIVRATIPKK